MDKSSSVVLVGADPELFVFNKERGAFTSAIPYFKKGKEKGEPVPNVDGASVLHDNVALEFNCKAYSSAESFSSDMMMIVAETQKLLQERANQHHVLVCNVGSAFLDQRLLRHVDARTFGCSPDYNAYTSMRNPRPEAEAVGNMRVIGGHIHIGSTGSATPRLSTILSTTVGEGC
jgi:hypothetical protein